MNKTRPVLAFTATGIIAGMLFLAGCGEKLPKEKSGSGETYTLGVTVPPGGLKTSVDMDVGITVSAGGKRQHVDMKSGIQTMCGPGENLNGSDRRASICRFLNISIAMNQFRASSDEVPEPKPKRSAGPPYWPEPVNPFRSPSEQRKEGARRRLVAELKKIVNDVSVTLEYGSGMTESTVSGIDPARLSQFSDTGKPILRSLLDPDQVVSMFVAGASRMLPEKPVAVGAVWHVRTPNTYVPDMPMDTAVVLESVTQRGPDRIARLKATSLLTIHGSTSLVTPAGERVRVKNCTFKTTSAIVLNITKKIEESTRSNLEGRYTVKKGSRSAKCAMMVTTRITRVQMPSEPVAGTE